MVLKWQEEARRQVKEQGEKEYDFLNEPDLLMNKIKKDAKDYAEEEWSLNNYFSKSKNICK